MTNDRIKRMQEVFHASLECAPQERAGFLNQACADDPELRKEVESLLAAHDSAASFLDAPAIKQAQPLFAETATQIQMPATPRLISHYEIGSLLGKGGMGEVYLATDTSLGRKAALKILPARYTTEPDLVHRFEREAKAASALNHPNILTVYEIGKTEDSHFIATEFIEGETLRDRLKRGNLPLQEALDIAIQIAAALTAAHEAGIIHRDIKPENIMLRPDGYVKVLDFGLAKLMEQSQRRGEGEKGRRGEDDPTLPLSPSLPHSPPPLLSTMPGIVMGTPSYMSPEQARGQKVDARSDIWSLGVVLFEMVSGARPFGGDTQADLLVAILEREPLQLPVGLPPELEHTIHQTLAKDPNDRCATVREVGQTLKAVQHKLALTSELKHFAAQAEETTIRQVLEAPTLELAPVLQTQHNPAASQAVASVPPAPPPARISARASLLGVLVVAGLSIGSWYWFQPAMPLPPTAKQSAAPQPQRELTWWLTAQRMIAGKLEGQPLQSAGRDWFPNGSRFKFNLTSPQAGYLYLLNEGLTTGGQTSLNLLYPTPANNNLNAAVAANQNIQTGNNIFAEHQGEEKFWIVWAAQPIPEIEAIKTVAQPEIKNVTQRAAILALLNQHLPQSVAKSDETKEQTTVTSTSDLLANLVKLKHR